MTRTTTHLLFGLLALSLFAAFATPAEARTRSRSTERQRGSSHKESSITNNRGQTSTRTADRTWDRDTRTGTVATQTTLPDGRTAGREGTFQRNPDGSASAQGTYHRFNGQTGTYQATSQKTETGRVSHAERTSADGRTASVDSTRVRTEDGFNRTTTKTAANGHSVTKEVDVSKTDAGTTRAVTRTHSGTSQ